MRLRPLILVVVVVTLLVALLGACTPEEASLSSRINDYRRANGRAEVLWHNGLYAKARAQAEALAACECYYHSNLSYMRPPGALVLGENVTGSWMDQPDPMLDAHTRFLGSPRHRDNVLDPRWNKYAVAVVPGELTANGHVYRMYYIVELFGQIR